MIDIKPFKAIRPPRDKAYLVATRSYLSYTDAELDDKLRNNPFTFLHIINPKEGRHLAPGTKKYQLVKANFQEWCEKGILQKDTQNAFYLYRQEKEGNEYIGVIAAVSVKDYQSDRIKKHENTLSHREEMFTDYLESTGFNAEPVLLVHRDNNLLNQLYARYINQRAEYEFTSTDRVMHQLWLIEEKADCEQISTIIGSQEQLYIADGHHRCASSSLLAERLSERDSADGPHSYFMAFLIGEEQMKVFDFNRLVKNDSAKGAIEILKELEANFIIENKGAEAFKPERLHEMGMYLKGEWYKLSPKIGSFDAGHAVGHLDAQILSENILAPVFDITNLKTDHRVDFMPGTEGLDKLQAQVDNGRFDLAFSLYPVSIEQLKEVSDLGLTMPPKSTYIEPKLRSGLTIYPIR
jgi:uncharacterized protein (DUF1015 family)